MCEHLLRFGAVVQLFLPEAGFGCLGRAGDCEALSCVACSRVCARACGLRVGCVCVRDLAAHRSGEGIQRQLKFGGAAMHNLQGGDV